ncbi:hypothetical protein M8A51_18410 [Schlegelella sp. S2-27]|uniref:Uncharacterized protein n=1 Tax=Caldimonas mangrovi TaxID=2944811 RepID=A0ABT0YRZ5_9BURK|nr:hypothetical protein [Caldimonas mangrovi]MCM5681504.1 hypothetical protein [Caldimonas mangrovi]
MSQYLSSAPAPGSSFPGAATPFVPPSRTGLVQLPGSTRVVWWTGRVAIGLQYSPPRPAAATVGTQPRPD